MWSRNLGRRRKLPFVQQGAEAAVAWLETTGKTNVEELNQVLRESAVSVFEKIQ